MNSSEETDRVASGEPVSEDPAVAPSPVPAETETETEADTGDTAQASAVPGEQVPEASAAAPATAETAPEGATSATPAPVAADAASEKTEAETNEATPAAAAKPARKVVRNPSLMRAFRTGRAVEGKIVAVIKGGFEVRIGRSRGFCPGSQMVLEPGESPETVVGTRPLFRVTQVRRGGEDVVVSRRALLEEAQAEEAKAVRATLIEGAVMQGRVANLAAFGAFVDLGAGVRGLVHISELSHVRVDKVEDAVKVGDTVQVKVLKLDDSRGRISLSVRRATSHPWSGIADRFIPGQSYPGTVCRVAEFGAFVELAPGVEALAPASEFPPSAGGWASGLEPGTSGEWKVLSVSPKQRRISVALPGDGAVEGEIAAGRNCTGKVQRLERFGVFVWLGPGSVGLMPRSWCGEAGANLERSFPIGDPVEVVVQEVSEGGRKLRLSLQGVDITPEEPPTRARKRPRDEPREALPQEDHGTFGTSLADKLKAALERGDSRG